MCQEEFLADCNYRIEYSKYARDEKGPKEEVVNVVKYVFLQILIRLIMKYV